MKIVTIPASAPALVSLLAMLAAAPAAAQDYALVAANLFGKGVVGGGAADGGGGDFNGEIDFERGSICYYFEAYGLDGANAAHIHRGAEGGTGEAVMTLPVPGEKAEDEVCVEAEDAVLRAIAADPKAYYVDIHTPALAEAALRGQLHD